MKLKRGYLLSFISLFGNCFCAGNFEGRNVALGGKPSQGPRSTANGEAHLTVDGNTSTAAGACVHTQGNTPYRPWWRLDLHRSHWISGIKIFNIEPKLRERILGMYVRGMTPHGQWPILFIDDLKANELRTNSCSYPELGKDVCADVIEIEINPAKELSQIEITRPDYLTLCEIEIFEVACRVPDAPVHGMYLYPNTTSPREYVPFNSEIVLSCDTGISISKSNSDKRKCLKTGNFDKTDLICTGNCQMPIVQNGFYSTNSQRFVNGTVSSGMYIYLHCNDGYELKDQRQSLKCDADSLFVSTHPSCEEIKCNNLPSRFSNGFYTPPIKKDTFSYNFTFVPVCKTGFTLVSEQNRTCISKNKWSGSTPSCTQVTCQVPILSNGYYLSKKKLAVSLPTFETIQPYCHTGYLLTRSENLTCQKDGHFSVGNSECKIATCSSFGKLENGILHYSEGFITHQDADIGKNYRFGVKVRASCIPGFHLTRGSTEQTCTENGTWDGVKPACSKIRCNDTGILSSRFQQSYTMFSFLERGTASYNNSIYYLVNGSLSFICLANRSLLWEFQPPELASICKVQYRDNLIVNTNGCLREDTCEIGKRVSYDCVGDYEVSVRNASCKADHTWSAEPFCTYNDQIVDNAQTGKASVATISAAVGGIAVVIAAILVILFICRHRSKAAKSPSRSHYEMTVKTDADQSNCYSEINVSQLTNGDDAALSRSNSYLSPVVTDGNYYESVD